MRKINSRIRASRKTMAVALSVIIVLLGTPRPAVFAAGMTPGRLLDDLRRVLLKQATIENWKAELDPAFNVWTRRGSENLTVISAVIGLFREPNLSMPGGNINYVNWLTKYLASQTGQMTLTDPPNLRYFKNSEIFSNTYDAPVVASILAVRYWARLNNDALLADYSRRYLRATWAAYGLAAGSGPVRDHMIDQWTPSFLDDVTIRSDGTYLYDGPFLALAGARSSFGHRLGDGKEHLFGRVSAWAVTRSDESPSQRDLINLLLQRWAALPSQAETLYAVTPSEQGMLRDLANFGSNVPTVMSWLSGIRTKLTYRILAWPGVRASLMEYNPSGLNPNMYGIVYYASNMTAHYLFPWTEAGGGGLPRGWAKLETGAMTASNEPGSYVIVDGQVRWKHPPKTVTAPIPTTTPIYHVVFSQNADPYLDSTAPAYFPPREPPDIDWPRNP